MKTSVHGVDLGLGSQLDPGADTQSTSTPAYSLVGNGWCTNKQIGGHHRIGIQGGGWTNVAIHKKDGADAATSCEERCSKEASCIGYITEDGRKCHIIPGTKWGGMATSITGHDDEHRNWCWRKGKGTVSNKHVVYLKMQEGTHRTYCRTVALRYRVRLVTPARRSFVRCSPLVEVPSVATPLGCAGHIFLFL